MKVEDSKVRSSSPPTSGIMCRGVARNGVVVDEVEGKLEGSDCGSGSLRATDSIWIRSARDQLPHSTSTSTMSTTVAAPGPSDGVLSKRKRWVCLY
jgi:hypothetical protein